MCCCCCGDCCLISTKLLPRIGFILISIIMALLSVFFSYIVPQVLMLFQYILDCPNGENLVVCLGISSIYRMSFGLFVMHLLVIIVSLFGIKWANLANQGCWLLKVLIVLGFFFGGLYIPNRVFIYYAFSSRVISVIFLLYQTIVTISFGHVINIKLFNGVDNKYTGWIYKVLLLGFTLLFFLITIGFTVEIFFWYKFRMIYLLIIGGSFLIGVILTVISISPIVENKRLLTSLYIFSYIMYLTWSAINSIPDAQLRLSTKIIDSSKRYLIDMGAGLLYVGLGLSFLGFFVKKTSAESEEDRVLSKSPMLETDDSNYNEGIVSLNEDEDEGYSGRVPLAHFYFHCFMMVLSIYYCMLLTNWGSMVEADNPQLYYKSWIGFGIKMGLMGFTSLLYLWVLIAPRCFPDREFDF